MLIELCENDGTGPILFQDPHDWSSVTEAWSYWENRSEEYDLVLVSVDPR